MRDLLRSKHFVVTLEDDGRVLRRARTPERFDSLEDLEAAYDALIAALDRVDRSTVGQLVDARPAPPRNDAEFESAVMRRHALLYQGFRASAVVVQTAAGKLQVRRMLDTTGVDAPVFLDEAEAIAHLHAAVAHRPSRRP